MRLNELVSLASDEVLRRWGVAAEMEHIELAHLDGARLRAWTRAYGVAGRRIHPTARVSARAVIGDDVMIGPDCVVHEFATVRDGSILAGGVEIGHGCEVSRSVVASETRLAHQIVLCDAVVGRGAHLSAAVVLGSVHLWSHDMRHPDRTITVKIDSGTRYRSERTKFGGVLGDGVRVGMGALLGPGLLVGAGSVLYPGVVAAQRFIPARSVVRTRPTPLVIEPRRPDRRADPEDWAADDGMALITDAS